MTKMNSDLVEQAQIIAGCVGYTKTEIKKLDSKMRKVIEEQLASIPGINIDEITEHVLSKIPTPELPGGLIFESHLHESEAESKKALNSITQSLSQYISENDDTVTKTRQELAESDARFMERYSLMDSSVQDRISSIIQHVNENLDALRQAITGVHESMKQMLSEAVSILNKDFSTEVEYRVKSEKEFRDGLHDAMQKLHLLGDDIADCMKTFTEKFNQQYDVNANLSKSIAKVEGQVSRNTDNLFTLAKSTSQEIKSLQDANYKQDQSIDSLNRSKADSTHEHTHYSRVEHNHPDKADASALREHVASVGTKINALDQEVSQVVRALKNKVDTDKALTDDDLEDLAVRIKEAVLHSIPKPEDGKNAFEWEFKFHETSRGVFMYKREDWKHWRTQNLLGPAQQQASSPASFGGAGGSISVMQGRPSYFNDEAVKNRIDLFYTTLTDDDGFFSINSDVYNKLDVIHNIDATALMIQDPSLSPLERKVDVIIEEITPGGIISGYAFCHKSSTFLIGNTENNMVPATDHEVMIQIVGAIIPA